MGHVLSCRWQLPWVQWFDLGLLTIFLQHLSEGTLRV